MRRYSRRGRSLYAFITDLPVPVVEPSGQGVMPMGVHKEAGGTQSPVCELRWRWLMIQRKTSALRFCRLTRRDHGQSHCAPRHGGAASSVCD